jgi:hypothetical protein
MEKMRGVKPKNTSPTLVAGNTEVASEARKGRKRGGKAMSEKMEGEKSMKRGDRACRASGGMLAGSDWQAAQGPGKKPSR